MRVVWASLLSVALIGGGLAVAGDALGHPGPNAELLRLDRAIAEAPHEVNLRLQRARVLRQLGHLNRAGRDLAAVERAEPDSRALQLERALWLRDRGDSRGAERQLDALLASGAPSQVALKTRAELRAKTGRLEEAWQDYERAFALGPTPELALARGALDERLRKWDRAAAGYEAALLRLSGAVVVRLAAVRVERARGEFASALRHVDALLGAATMRGEYLLLRAEIHAQAGKPDAAHADRLAALQEVERVLSVRNTAMHHTLRGRVLLALSRRDEARAALRQALTLQPGYEPAKDLVATLEGRSGRDG